MQLQDHQEEELFAQNQKTPNYVRKIKQNTGVALAAYYTWSSFLVLTLLMQFESYQRQWMVQQKAI
jgi:hypothetical protein